MKYDLIALHEAIIKNITNNGLVIRHKWYSKDTIELIDKLDEEIDGYYSYQVSDSKKEEMKEKISSLKSKLFDSLSNDLTKLQ